MAFLGFAVAWVAFAAFAARRLTRYLHIMQQDDYNGARFLRWMFASCSFDKRVSLILLAILAVGMLVTSMPVWAIDIICGVVFAAFAFYEPDPRKAAKKKLVMTARATRIFAVALAFSVIIGGLLLASNDAVAYILAVQLIPFLLVAANIALSPFEASVQKKIMEEAKARLAKINPHIVGVTGSFGKTSVKHILGHILEMNAPTLFTPGSVNTLMGISRIIRENLPADCKYFIVEMGAYGPGSIKKLCGLTPPRAGIITAIGEAHVERFKTLDTVARAKFELAEAVLAQSGQVVVHENVLAQDYAKQFVAQHRDRFITAGASDNADAHISNVHQTSSGLTFTLRWGGQDYALTVPLFGIHHAGNIALAFVTAASLGIAPDRIVAALRTVPQITHRLEVKPQPDGAIYIDDAFNSNPAGFVGALELMSTLAADKKRRRILVTPGIVELGDKHDQVHAALGTAAAKNADIALAVKPDRIKAFIDGFTAANMGGVIHPVANFAAAQKWLAENGKPDDVVLIENDLPDVHEKKLAV